jgi:hypothetical protein
MQVKERTTSRSPDSYRIVPWGTDGGSQKDILRRTILDEFPSPIDRAASEKDPL